MAKIFGGYQNKSYICHRFLISAFSEINYTEVGRFPCTNLFFYVKYLVVKNKCRTFVDIFTV